HTFSAICKSKPVYNYTITEHEIKSLQHNALIKRGCDLLAGFLVGVLIFVSVWMINNDDDWKKIPVLGISVVLLLFVVILGGETRSNSEEIWENVKQVSEVICEKK
ncbi:hypothetical protein, partial [Bartonella japonica]|uniref:hypothetical protein n=1 Tax=Bartonella japonica TaxID=357761 RepID=UPI003394777C